MATYKIGYVVRYYENIHNLKYTFKRISKRDAIRAYNNGLRVIVTTKNALPCDYMNYDGNIIRIGVII